MTTNSEIDELLSAYLDGQLSPEQANQIRERLLREPHLAQLFEQLQSHSMLIRQMPRCTARQDFSEAVLSAARTNGMFSDLVQTAAVGNVTVPVWRSWRSRGIAIATTAALLLIAAFFWPKFVSETPKRVADSNSAVTSSPDRLNPDRFNNDVVAGGAATPKLAEGADSSRSLAMSRESNANEVNDGVQSGKGAAPEDPSTAYRFPSDMKIAGADVGVAETHAGNDATAKSAKDIPARELTASAGDTSPPNVQAILKGVEERQSFDRSKPDSNSKLAMGNEPSIAPAAPGASSDPTAEKIADSSFKPPVPGAEMQSAAAADDAKQATADAARMAASESASDSGKSLANPELKQMDSVRASGVIAQGALTAGGPYAVSEVWIVNVDVPESSDSGVTIKDALLRKSENSLTRARRSAETTTEPSTCSFVISTSGDQLPDYLQKIRENAEVVALDQAQLHELTNALELPDLSTRDQAPDDTMSELGKNLEPGRFTQPQSGDQWDDEKTESDRAQGNLTIQYLGLQKKAGELLTDWQTANRLAGPEAPKQQSRAGLAGNEFDPQGGLGLGLEFQPKGDEGARASESKKANRSGSDEHSFGGGGEGRKTEKEKGGADDEPDRQPEGNQLEHGDALGEPRKAINKDLADHPVELANSPAPVRHVLIFLRPNAKPGNAAPAGPVK